jgi:UDP-galactopyranose mutase
MPKHGFTRMFERMLAHPKITKRLGCKFSDVRDQVAYRRVIYTGPIDEFFEFKCGRLPYRSLSFEHVTLNRQWHQDVAVVNYPQHEAFTRITEYKHLTGQLHQQTSISYEYPCAQGDPYYPIPRPENQARYREYEKLARSARDVYFVGRLGTYMYYNMDQVVGQALATYRRIEDTIGRPESAVRAIASAVPEVALSAFAQQS